MKEELEANAALIHIAVITSHKAWLFQHHDASFEGIPETLTYVEQLPAGTDWALLANLTEVVVAKNTAGVCLVLLFENNTFSLGLIGHGAAELFGAPTEKTIWWLVWDSLIGQEVAAYFNSMNFNINYYGK